MGRRGYPAEFRRKVLDLVDAGRKVADVARDLGVSDQTIYNWRLQDRIDRGLEPGATSAGRPTTSASSRTTTSWRRTRRRVRCSSWSRSRSTTSTRRTPRCTPPVTATPRTTSRRTPPNGSRPTATRSTAGSRRRARADGAPRHRPTMGGRPEAIAGPTLHNRDDGTPIGRGARHDEPPAEPARRGRRRGARRGARGQHRRRMQQAFLDYSMSVIVGRALPDVRDRLKRRRVRRSGK